MFISKNLLSLLTIGLLTLSSLASTPQVHAQGQVTLYPGQTGQFSVTYENKGDVSEVQSAVIEIYLGNKLELDTSSITESFGGGTLYCLAPSVVSTDSAQTGSWGYKITYRPRSATTTTAPCNGENTPGPATITAAPENPTPASKQGVISFKAKLKDTVTDPAGTQLRPIGNQGIYADSKIGTTNVPSSFVIVVGEKPAQTTSTAGTSTSTSGTSTATTSTSTSGTSTSTSSTATSTSGTSTSTSTATTSTSGTATSTSTSGTSTSSTSSSTSGTSTSTAATSTSTSTASTATSTASTATSTSGAVVQTKLTRTGGIALIGVLAAASGLIATAAFFITRKKKLQVK
jgi:hypothetical protein